jgi:hypothetical protein
MLTLFERRPVLGPTLALLAVLFPGLSALGQYLDPELAFRWEAYLAAAGAKPDHETMSVYRDGRVVYRMDCEDPARKVQRRLQIPASEAAGFPGRMKAICLLKSTRTWHQPDSAALEFQGTPQERPMLCQLVLRPAEWEQEALRAAASIVDDLRKRALSAPP